MFSVTLSLILLLLAVVMLGLAAFGVPSLMPRFNWLGGGLFCWALSTLVAGARF